jgi:hypothetical protein
MVLHRVAAGLALPTRKSSAVIRDGESESCDGRTWLFHNATKNVFAPRFWLRKINRFIFLASALLAGSDSIVWCPTSSYAQPANMIFPVSGTWLT